MEEVLGVIFSIILIFWVLGIIGRMFLRYWVVKKQRQMEQQMRDGGAGGSFQSFGGGNFRGFYSTFSGRPGEPQRSSKPEGEVTIEKSEQTKATNHKIGEYVDFEEVK